jgi:hypothetical protein
MSCLLFSGSRFPVECRRWSDQFFSTVGHLLDQGWDGDLDWAFPWIGRK